MLCGLDPKLHLSGNQRGSNPLASIWEKLSIKGNAIWFERMATMNTFQLDVEALWACKECMDQIPAPTQDESIANNDLDPIFSNLNIVFELSQEEV